MAIKPSGRMCAIREQIIEDPVSGLTFQFECKPGSDAPVRLRIFGNLPYGTERSFSTKTAKKRGQEPHLLAPAAQAGLKRSYRPLYALRSLQRGSCPCWV